MTADASFWNNLAAEYAAKPVDHPEVFDRKIALTAAVLRPGDRVVEFGCGTGSLIWRLAPTGAHLHGVDVAEEMLVFARAKADSHPSAQVSFARGGFDRSYTRDADGSMDAVLAFSVLHLMADWREAVQLAFDLLKPGGSFVSSTAVLGGSWMPYRPLLALARWLGKAPYVEILSAQGLEAELRSVGFVDVTRPDIGTAANTSFLLAKKPA